MRIRKVLAGGLLALSLAFPAAASALPVTSDFGWRVHPVTGTQKFHTGVDLGYPYGTPIPAMFDGVVVAVGNFGDGYGNQVLLYHGAYDTYTRYAHMEATGVALGTYVPQGWIIGWVGSTGNSTGPHLHLEYIVRDEMGQYVYVDPLALWQ